MQQLKQLKLEKIKRLAKNDFYYFAKHILGSDLMAKQPHQELCDLLTSDSPKKLILLPRGSFKSTVTTVGYTLWRLAYNPNLRVLISSENFSNSAKYLGEIKDHMANNKLFRALYGDWKPKDPGFWTKENITISTRTKVGFKEPTITASGVGQTKVGMHYDLVVLDDIVSNNNIATPEQIMKTLDYYRLILSLPDPGSTLIIIGTRYHYNDLYGHILENEPENYDTIVRKAYQDDGTLYFPTRLTDEFLKEQKKAQGSSHFSNQYQNEPIDAETAMFRREWLKFYTTVPDNLRHFIVTDAAASLSNTADYSVVMILGVDQYSNIFVLDPWRGRVTISDFIDRIFRRVHDYNVQDEGTVTIETNAFQQTIKFMLCEEMNKRKLWFSITEVKPNSRQTKVRRIQALQPYFEHGKIFIKEEHQDLMDEILRFPKTRYDDLIDALSDCVQIIYPATALAADPWEDSKLTKNEQDVWKEVEKLGRKVKRTKKWRI